MNIYKLKYNCLTHYNILLLLISIYYTNLQNLYAISYSLSWIIFITFNSSMLLDNTSFERIRKKNEFSYLEFHIGNFVLHTVPCIYLYNYPPNKLDYSHSLCAILFKLLWCYVSSKGTMDLSRIYIDFNKKINLALYTISVSTGLCIPLVFNKYYLLN